MKMHGGGGGGAEGTKLSYGGVAKSMMHGLTNIPTFACMSMFDIGL